MISRRELLTGGFAVGAAGLLGLRHAALAAASPPRTKLNFEVPAGSCDCSVHVFGDPQRYPLFSGRSYTPDPAPLDELRQLLQALHMDRVVIVQATIYGTDNACALDSLRALGNRARGVTMVDEKNTEASLDEMNRIGMRGIRLNIGGLGVTDPSSARQQLRTAAARAQKRGWHIQLTARADTFEALREDLAALPVPLVIDHFGGITAAKGVSQTGFATLVSLVRSGKAYVKISNAESISTRPDLADVEPFAKAYVAANPSRVVWGTAWPHPGSVAGRKPTELSPNRQTDDGKVINMLPVWIPDPAVRRMVLVDNPARLYGFS